MAQGRVGSSHSWSRRQFLARGAATVGVFAVGGLIQAGPAAAGGVVAVPSGEELSVVGGLVSAILVATGQTGDGSGFGLLTPAEVAQGFSSVEVDVQAEILGVLDAIERAPAAGLFSSLSDAQRQAFIREALSTLQVSIPPDPAFEQQLTAVYAAFIDQVNNGTLPSETQGIAPQFLDSDPPDPPADVTPPPEGPPVPADELLAVTVLAGLQFVALPLPFASPPAPPLPSPDVVASLTTILPLDSLGILDDTVNQLVDQLVAAVDAVDDGPDPPPVIPSPLLAQATAVWLP